MHLISDKLKQENESLRSENLTLKQRYTTMKNVILDYDMQAIDQDNEEQVIYFSNKLVLSWATDDRKLVIETSFTNRTAVWWRIDEIHIRVV